MRWKVAGHIRVLLGKGRAQGKSTSGKIPGPISTTITTHAQQLRLPGMATPTEAELAWVREKAPWKPKQIHTHMHLHIHMHNKCI